VRSAGCNGGKGLRKLLQGWAVQKRVLGALFMREIQIRWGRRNLGFLWLFAEPLVFAFPVLTMWSIVRGHSRPGGMPLIPFLWSGYLPLLIFRHVTGQALYTVRNNAAVMFHQAITPLDLYIGHCGMEALGNVSAVAFSFLVIYMIGGLDWPVNPPLVIFGVLYMTWWALAVALVVAAWSERTEMVEHVWNPISYMYMPLSGFFYLAAWLPTPLRHVALTVMPSLHCYEMIRAGMFGTSIETYYDTTYLTFVLAGLTVLGLWLMRDVRRYVQLEQ
jgi:capsular polysaccharide transport system permease protein